MSFLSQTLQWPCPSLGPCDSVLLLHPWIFTAEAMPSLRNAPFSDTGFEEVLGRIQLEMRPLCSGRCFKSRAAAACILEGQIQVTDGLLVVLEEAAVL